MRDALGGETRYEYDAIKRPRFVRRIPGLASGIAAGSHPAPPPSVVQYQYDDAGRLKTMIDPIGVVVGWTYNDDDQLTYYDLASRQDEALTRDGVGRVIRNTTWHTTNFTFDGLGRLTHSTSTHGAPSSDEFWYDAAGNRDRDERWDMSYDAAGKLVSKESGGCLLRYRYNLNGDQTEQYWDGNPCGDTKRVSTYDPAGRMTQLETWPAVCGTNQPPCYQPRTFWYDGLGRRILMRADSASGATSSGEQGLWRYWWIDDNVFVKTFNTPVAGEEDRDWPSIRRASDDTVSTGEWFFYAPGADNLLGSIAPLLARTRRHLFVRDYRGSVIQTTYEDGQALGISADWYQPFGGQSTGSTAKATEPGYNGHESAGGLIYMRNRWYDPNSGRFTQQDPIGFAGGSNLYGYTGGDPVNYSDPFGLCPKDAGGDGKTEEFDDCPEGSSGHYAQKDASGQGGLINTAQGVVASCKESLTCASVAVVGAAVAGGAAVRGGVAAAEGIAVRLQVSLGNAPTTAFLLGFAQRALKDQVPGSSLLPMPPPMNPAHGLGMRVGEFVKPAISLAKILAR